MLFSVCTSNKSFSQTYIPVCKVLCEMLQVCAVFVNFCVSEQVVDPPQFGFTEEVIASAPPSYSELNPTPQVHVGRPLSYE